MMAVNCVITSSIDVAGVEIEAGKLATFIASPFSYSTKSIIRNTTHDASSMCTRAYH